ncbi:synaptonemal complex central element protein 1-like [Spea bombifrons]|uniref:synaptonemal complex central element protein 1-like n=1 Tax=Spea bombifrons TaxID=233779 RepID=UPI00234B28A1|nr:synaptonemal complex central element protein 1-like [Spea bombifrons]
MSLHVFYVSVKWFTSHHYTAGDLAPSMEDVLGKITQLDHAKDLMSKDLKDHRMSRDAAQKELDELNAEKSRLEELLGKKRETLCVLRLQCDKKGSEKLRRQQISDGRNHRIQDLTSNIQGEKDKQRKQRMEFERQLEELSEKHKALWELHNEKRLALEISGMEDRKVQLRNEEREEHRKLTEMLHAIGTEGPARTADSSFRLSAEAAVKLFEEENMRAGSRRVATSVYQLRVQENHAR